MDLKNKYRNLQALAEDQAGTPEGELAAEMAARLLEKYPELELDAEEKLVRIEYKWAQEYERQLLLRLVLFWDLGIAFPRHKQRKRLVLEGPESIMPLITMQYKAHRRRLKSMLETVYVNYLAGAVPIPQKYHTKGNREMDEADEKLAFQAYMQGRKNRHSKARLALSPGTFVEGE